MQSNSPPPILLYLVISEINFKEEEEEEVNLNNTVIFVIDQTVRTESISHTVQTEHVAFAFIRISMNYAGDEVAGPQHWF